MPKEQSALDAFMVNHAEALRRAKAIVSFLEDHMEVAPEEVHWGHVGSAGKAREDLEELACFLQVGPEHYE